MASVKDVEVLLAEDNPGDLELIEDVDRRYAAGAGCCITKPIGCEEFLKIVTSIQDFWMPIVKLPTANSRIIIHVMRGTRIYA
jgi:hypothetical protein